MKAYIIVLLLLTASFVVAMWFLDFAIWYNHTYLYLPVPGLWGVKFVKGDAVNLAYWWLILTYTSAVTAAFIAGLKAAEEMVEKALKKVRR